MPVLNLAQAAFEVVPLHLLEDLARLVPASNGNGAGAFHSTNSQFDIDRWLLRHAVPVTESRPYKDGGRIWSFEKGVCPFGGDHGPQDKAPYLIQHASGALSAGCLHNGCAGKKWADLRKRFEPAWTGTKINTGQSARKSETSKAREVILIHAETVIPEELEWVWSNRVAAGKFSLFCGDPGLGKSWASQDFASRVSTGTDFPDGTSCKRGSVLILSDEDGLRDTIVPRLLAQGADMAKIKIVRVNDGSLFDLSGDLDALETFTDAIGDVRLIIVDPLTAYLGDVDPNKDARVRQILTPLAAFAEKHRIALLGIMHLNKAATLDAVYRVTGSVAFVGQARSVWVVATDPENPARRIFQSLKRNLAPDNLGGLAFTIENNALGRGTLIWEQGRVDVDVHQLLGGFANKPRGPRPNKSKAAEDVIMKILGDGEKHLSDELDDAARAAGISHGTLNKKRRELGVRNWREQGDNGQFTGPWFVQLKPNAPKEEASENAAD